MINTENSKILVVDDNAVNLKLLQRTLQKAKYEVLTAYDGQEAIDVAIANQPDLIMLDVMMPGMNGFEACEILRSREETKMTPIIFITAKNDSVDKVRGLALGANDYITKPFDTVEVIARVQTHLRIQNLHKQLMIKNVQLETAYADLHEKTEKINKDIKAAGMVQRRLIPQNQRTHGPLEFSWQFIPSSHVAGDIFNFMPIDDKHLAVFIIDVSGHGVQSAMLAVQVHNFIRIGTEHKITKDKDNNSKSIYEPQQIAEALNSIFTMDVFDAYFTAIYMVINIETMEAKIVNAGHPYPVLIHADKTYEFVEHADIPIGMMDNMVYECFKLQLKKGDKLLLYTDGLFEIPMDNSNVVDKKLIIDLLLESDPDLQKSMEKTIKAILEKSLVDQFDDDVSLFGIEIK